MPTNRTKRHAERRQVATIDQSLEYELLTGRGYGNKFADRDEMQTAWEIHRDEIRATWAAENPPGTRCFAEWLFELAPTYGPLPTNELFNESLRAKYTIHGLLFAPRQFMEPQHEYLYRHGLIDANEAAEAAAN